MIRRDAPLTPPPSAAVTAHLRRLGLLPRPRETSDAAAAVEGGLLEAFGDTSWRRLGERDVLARLEAAEPPAGGRGERRLRYAALAAEGVVECVIGLGFDDAEAAESAATDPAAELAAAFAARGYAEGPAAAAPLLTAIGRPCEEDGATTYFARADGARVAPPAGQARDVGVVVRVVANRGGGGEAAARAFRDGLRHARMCLYVGHWRYGLGPDFDRAPAVEAAPGGGLPADPGRLLRAARADARRSGETLEAVLDRWLAGGRVVARGRAASRVTLGHANLLPRDPAARAVHWAARRDGEDGLGPLVAPCGPGYRVWMLIGCRSALGFPALRAALPPGAVRLVGLRGVSSLRNWRSLPWVLDAVRAGGTWREVAGAVNGCGEGVVVDGCEEDPWID